MKIMQLKITISLLLLSFILTGCGDFLGFRSHCDGFTPPPVYAYIDSTDKPVYFNFPPTNRISLYNPVPKPGMGMLNYPYNTNILAFPLFVNSTIMQYQIFQNNIVLDTLTIEYKIEPEYYKGDECNDPQLVAKAIVNKCYTKGHYFEVRGFH